MSGYNMAANMYGMMPNAYNNQVALNDLCDLDLYSPTGGMGMGGSIFGGPMMMGSGMGMGGMGMGYPMAPMYGGMGGNNQDYYKNYEKYQDFMIQNQVRQQQRMRGADLSLNSPQEGIAKQAALLREKIVQDEQQQIIPAYNRYIESVKNMYGEGTAEQIANRASTLYAQQYGATIPDDIRRYGKGSLTQGLLQTVTLGYADNRTAEQNAAELTGQPISRYDNAKKIAGNAAGGAIFGTGAAIALKCLWKGKGPIFSALKRIPVLAAIGGIAAGTMAFATKES